MEAKNKPSESSQAADKEKVLGLIISQLSNYGFASLASVIAKHTNTRMKAESSDLLARLVYIGEKNIDSKNTSNFQHLNQSDFNLQNEPDKAIAADNKNETTLEMNLEKESVNSIKNINNLNQSNVPPKYKFIYQTSHKGPATTAAFSKNGLFFATGSADSTLKVVSIERLNSANERSNSEEKPVIRTLYDHRDVVNEVAFHPNGLILASCSDDQSIKLFDLSLAQGKRSFRFILNNAPISSISFHPTGDFLASGTSDGKFSVYDIKTLSGFTPNCNPSDLHTARINSIRFNYTGNILATASVDGAIKLWDGVSGKIINTIPQAHGNMPINSLNFSADNKYILTSGQDYITRLWDATSGNLVSSYEFTLKSNNTANSSLRSHGNSNIYSSFTANSSFILANDPLSNSIACWNVMDSSPVVNYGGFSENINCIATSPTDLSFAV
ncbi:hypothetical protein BB561_002236 [Smittium simulii]|uniref:Cleavage stimulation factor 50 kDa subunit n=1 Tax=Smittium simulii TaxID=133385 RepID=A0A2T9YR78_9FUNG|nr:hypothetical protein BB561_002236 [Smittium simulii]